MGIFTDVRKLSNQCHLRYIFLNLIERTNEQINERVESVHVFYKEYCNFQLSLGIFLAHRLRFQFDVLIKQKIELRIKKVLLFITSCFFSL